MHAGQANSTAVLEYFQDKMPYGLAVPDVSLVLVVVWLIPNSYLLGTCAGIGLVAR